MKFTKQQFEGKYPNNEACLHKIFTLRHGNATQCPICKKSFDYKRVNHQSKIKKFQRTAYYCTHCANQIYPLAGTIFEKTTTPLKDWFYALYLFTATRNGVSAKELERQLDICYKTALRMAHQLKKLMANHQQGVLNGIVEIDETYIGGSAKFMHTHKRKAINRIGGLGKINVFGMLQRDGQIIAEIVPANDGETLKPIIRERIEENSTLITDSMGAYRDIDKSNFKHEIVNHTQNEWVRGNFHTNSIEGFWSQLKRMIKGTHIKVSRKHLQKYIDECATRYILRNNPGEMFEIILRRVA